jgi:hypothetical protein
MASVHNGPTVINEGERSLVLWRSPSVPVLPNDLRRWRRTIRERLRRTPTRMVAGRCAHCGRPITVRMAAAAVATLAGEMTCGRNCKTRRYQQRRDTIRRLKRVCRDSPDVTTRIASAAWLLAERIPLDDLVSALLSCLGKMRLTETDAGDRARQMEPRDGKESVDAYPCEICNSWHIGNAGHYMIGDPGRKARLHQVRLDLMARAAAADLTEVLIRSLAIAPKRIRDNLRNAILTIDATGPSRWPDARRSQARPRHDSSEGRQ